MFHVYTYGKGSIQFLILSPKSAALMNKFTDAFLEAQANFLEKNGRHWTPNDPIAFDDAKLSSKEMSAYNKLAGRCDPQHTIRNKIFTLLRIDVSNEEFDNHLVKRF